MSMARKSIQKRIRRKRRGRGGGSCWGWVGRIIDSIVTRRHWVKGSMMIMMITNNSSNINNNTNIYNNFRRWNPPKWTNRCWATSPNRPSTSNSSSNNNSTPNTPPTSNNATTWSNCHYVPLTPNPSTTTSNHKSDKYRSTGCCLLRKFPKMILISLMKYYNKGWMSLWWVTSRKRVRSHRRRISWVRMKSSSRMTKRIITITSFNITWWQCPGYRNWTRRRISSII